MMLEGRPVHCLCHQTSASAESGTLILGACVIELHLFHFRLYIVKCVYDR